MYISCSRHRCVCVSHFSSSPLPLFSLFPLLFALDVLDLLVGTLSPPRPRYSPLIGWGPGEAGFIGRDVGFSPASSARCLVSNQSTGRLFFQRLSPFENALKLYISHFMTHKNTNSVSLKKRLIESVLLRGRERK